MPFTALFYEEFLIKLDKFFIHFPCLSLSLLIDYSYNVLPLNKGGDIKWVTTVDTAMAAVDTAAEVPLY
jgi:hypothetical protein